MRRRRARLALLGFLALAVAAPPGAAGSPYSGKTAQGLKITVAAPGPHQLRLLRVKVKLRCRDGGVLVDDLSDFEPVAVSPSGRFSDVQFGSSDEVTLRGRLADGSLRGRLRIKDRLAGGVPCDSGKVGFSLSLKRASP